MVDPGTVQMPIHFVMLRECLAPTLPLDWQRYIKRTRCLLAQWIKQRDLFDGNDLLSIFQLECFSFVD